MLALKAAAKTTRTAHLRARHPSHLSVRFLAVVANAPIPSKTKVWDSVEEAIKDVKSGDILLSGGFGLSGIPETLLAAMGKRKDVKNLIAVSNNAGVGELGLVHLIKAGQIDRLMISYLGGNKFLESEYLAGRVGIELVPQGTLSQRIMSHAAGIPAFLTPTGANTLVETGGIPIQFNSGGFESGVKVPGHPKEFQIINGRKYLIEPGIPGDVAFVHAWKADTVGNLVFRYASNNYNGAMARNAKLTIVEAEEIVPVGSLSPNAIHVPGIYVDRIVKATAPKEIEVMALAKDASSQTAKPDPAAEDALAHKDWRHRIARRAAREIHDGFYVNLGVGIPTLVPEHLDPSVKVWLESENGILGMGPYPTREQVDPDIINAGKETCTLLPGASTFDSVESFGMIRGGHIDVTCLGAMEVSSAGDIANFMIPGKLVKGIGGAMDLVSNPDQTKVIALTQHVSKDGKSKIVQQCSLPLTGARAVSMIVTDLAAFSVDRNAGEMTLVDVADGVTLEELRAKTDATFHVADKVGTF
ncbi:3-oxoacid CoA-transferase [Phanerochaete sordida]|uniref:Succinyl-CoA:3-ketoacid-coenzyme A transferase n=1 Tax=Phanerochaete sordida TaxID=48140 RepID=A0A9P3GKE8_9APHY|nr:3-oxoacid CoA-transferase [Phanerochaete sordida]